MNNPKKVLLCFTVLMLVMLGGMNIAPAQTVEQIAEKALAATVYLEMKDQNGVTLGFGNGFFVRENLIATNFHVIEGAAQGTAKLVGKYITYAIEGITATDKTNDLALLKVTAYGIKPLSLGISSDVKIGETVYIAGNLKGLESTFSDGIISSKHDEYAKKRFQMTAPISPGSNGGPVLNRNGEVIGVSVASYYNLASQNLNFAIPSNYLKVLLTDSVTNKPLWQSSQSISAKTYFKWGNTKYNIGLYQEAIFDYDKVIRLKPSYAEAYNNRGFAKNNLGQHFSAISDFDIAIQLKSDFADAYNNRGNAKADLNQHFAAISDYDIVIRLRPDYAGGYYNRGIQKHYLGQYKESIIDYDMAIHLKPDFAEAYVNRGIAKGKLGQHFAAISDYDASIRLKPNYSDAYYARGNAKKGLEQHNAAIEDYNMAIFLKPDFADAYHARGLSKGLLGQHTAAIMDCDRAIQIKHDHAKSYYVRGVSKLALDQTSEAKQDLQAALKFATQTNDADTKASTELLLQLLK